jgi:protein-S-isoprenylcysteine O-methyltransferase Ste14
MSNENRPSLIVRIPTPLWFFAFVVIALGVCALFPVQPTLRHWPTGAVLIVIGVALAGWGRLTFKKHNAAIIPASESHPAFVESGPFRFTRNPMYLGIIVLAIGVALVVGTWLMWLVPVVLFVFDNFVIIPFEERSMERTFGDAFVAYKARVRRWL